MGESERGIGAPDLNSVGIAPPLDCEAEFPAFPKGMEECFGKLPLPCRIVDASRNVVWQTPAFLATLQTSPGGLCCESLGLKHKDVDCPSVRTIRTAQSQYRTRWLGRLYVSIQTVAWRDPQTGDILSFEAFKDISSEKKLQSAFTQQQELLETINRAMIEINHHLETAQNELEVKNQSLEQANNQLRSLDHLKDEFISIVSHELKAPLTSIKGSVELIQTIEQGKLSPTGLELLTICRRNTDRLHNLVQDLLDVARIESGRLSLAFTRFVIADMVEESVAAVKQLADAKGLTLKCSLFEAHTMEGDRDRLVQVMINLLNNAVKFTDRGAVAIDVDGGSTGMVIRVTDTGVGIPADEQAHIFDKFAQVKGSFHRNAGGTGLGLSIARGIVREHGGELRVASEVGVGSCFSFTVPQPPGKDHSGQSSPLD